MDKISERVSEIVNIPDDRLSITPPVPKSIKIEITSHCDFKCYFCQLTMQDRAKGNIDDKLLYKILDESIAAGVEEVGLFWIGEPFLNKSLPRYIEYAKKVGFKNVFVTTNGRLANEEMLRSVFDAGLDSIKFSMNASSKESFKATTGVDAYDKVVKNIRAANSIRGDRIFPKIYASSVFDPDYPENYNDIDNQISPYVDEHYKIRLYGNSQLNNDNNELKKHGGNRLLQSMLPCWSLFTIPHISYDGHMSACFSDFNKNLYMADLNQVSFLEAWHSTAFQALRKSHLNKNIKGTPCQSCTAYAY